MGGAAGFAASGAQLAVFGMNGPMSNPPGNFIWARSATLDFFRAGEAGRVRPVPMEVVRPVPAGIERPGARPRGAADDQRALPLGFDDRREELPFSGVFCGLAFSPDEKYHYVGNWDPARKVVMRYEVRPDGGLASGQVFFDMTAAPGEDAIDGIKVAGRD